MDSSVTFLYASYILVHKRSTQMEYPFVYAPGFVQYII